MSADESAVLDLRGVDVTYRDAQTAALTGIDLCLRPGRIHAVLGPLGSGTSTLCRLAVGLLAQRGTVSGEAFATGTAVMLGDDPEAQLSGMASSVGDEVQVACRLHGHDPGHARSRAQATLASLAIDDLWDRRLETLSGGQRQLVALAGLLALDPALLVLDEPALSLDPSMRRRLVAALRSFASRGGAVLVTGHQFDEAAQASDAVSLLVDGRLVRTAEPQDLDPEHVTANGVWWSLPVAEGGTKPANRTFVGAGPTHRAHAADAVPGVDRPRAADAVPAVDRPCAVDRPRVEDETHPALLTIADLSVVRGGASVLDGSPAEIHAGELVALMGANGAGKSTLLRALLGLLDREAQVTGAMTVHHLGEGIDLRPLPTHARAAHLGWVGQDPGPQLCAPTVREELERTAPLPRHRRRERAAVLATRSAAVTSALERTGLTDVRDVHPFDLGTARRKDVVIATALVTAPTVLLLDEPTQGRDAAAMARLDGVIADVLARGGAVLAATHDRRWAVSSAHRILRLEQGRLKQARPEQTGVEQCGVEQSRPERSGVEQARGREDQSDERQIGR